MGNLCAVDSCLLSVSDFVDIFSELSYFGMLVKLFDHLRQSRSLALLSKINPVLVNFDLATEWQILELESVHILFNFLLRVAVTISKKFF